MSLQTSNTTCDIYRYSNSGPPAAPDVAGVSCFLTGAYGTGSRPAPAGQLPNNFIFTHIMLLDPTTDIRDAYQGTGASDGTADAVYVPDQNGTKFRVVFVERLGRGTVGDSLRAYLDRQHVTYPTSNL